MKILYSLLKEINNKTLDNGEKLYSMKEHELIVIYKKKFRNINKSTFYKQTRYKLKKIFCV